VWEWLCGGLDLRDEKVVSKVALSHAGSVDDREGADPRQYEILEHLLRASHHSSKKGA
jgi:hypothetical protein